MSASKHTSRSAGAKNFIAREESINIWFLRDLALGLAKSCRCDVMLRMAKTVKGRVGWEIVKKLLRAIPIIGPVFTVGFAGHDIKKKGLLPGAVHVGLDVTPVVGTAKNVVEIFTGDWIPDKPPRPSEPKPISATGPTKERGRLPNL
jgi:hypothetical protein